MMNHLTDICCKKLSTTFIPEDQGQWSDDIATATSNLQTEFWVLFNEVYFVSQQCINQSKGVITRLIHVRVSSNESDRCAATAGGCNLPWRLLTTCNHTQEEGIMNQQSSPRNENKNARNQYLTCTIPSLPSDWRVLTRETCTNQHNQPIWNVH